MIVLKTPTEIQKMKKAGKVVGDLLKHLEEKIKPGMTTKQLDTIADNFIKRQGARASFLGYMGYPASICVSIDDEVVHGIPSDKRYLEEGSIVSIDVGAIVDGWHGDAARTYAVGEISPEKKRLIEVTKESFFKGIENFKEGGRLGDISEAIQRYVEANGYSVVRQLVGHGIGREMHEEPSVPNYGRAGHGVRLSKGMVLAIEPMVNMGRYHVFTLEDGWTVKTEDGLPSAHYENTVALTGDGIEILTL